MAKNVLKRVAKNLYWSAYGKTVRNPPLPSDARAILFVCLGNICRSPFAERVAAKSPVPSNGVSFSSAGILVDTRRSPPVEAIDSAKTFGVDLQGHVSRQLRYSLMESHDIVAVMETRQYKYLTRMFLEFRNKIFLLPLFGEKRNTSLDSYSNYNIFDPYGRDASAYHECFARLGECISALLDQINRSKNILIK